MAVWSRNVKSGDPDNLEGRAAAFYWRNIFIENPHFTRQRDADDCNALFNYGYAILRAVIARALVGSGLLPTLGIHHHNRYNAYCLADDIMEPYRPYVDNVVMEIIREHGTDISLTPASKDWQTDTTVDDCSHNDISLIVKMLQRRESENIISGNNMQTTRLNQYKIMWVIVFFDLPVETKKQRKDYSDFRKRLLSDGFTMFQLSIYVRPCASQENSQVHINRVKSFLPEAGKICIMSITDRQFGDIIVFEGATKTPPKTNAIQLELF